ncbi:MAG: DUF805 domain-containing protein [Alphaproteobacteria bacterium]
MFDALRKYAVFNGRAQRKEYWLFILLTTIAYIVAMIIDGATGMGGLFSVVLFLGFIIPSFAVTVRRLHDTDRVGGWVFISLIPIIGGIILLVFACLDGTPGENRFGQNPKAE